MYSTIAEVCVNKQQAVGKAYVPSMGLASMISVQKTLSEPLITVNVSYIY